MKRLAIIVPVKAPREGKSRLAGLLSAQDREMLNLRLLTYTLDQVAELIDIADIHVVSKSPDVLAMARQRGFAECSEPNVSDLNGALNIGARHARAHGATEIMVLPVDLPSLSSGRLRSIVDEFRSGPDVMIIPDRLGEGTNLLMWRPIELADFHYGVGSAKLHADAAAKLGLCVAVRTDDELSFDLDTPLDFITWSGAKDMRVLPGTPRMELRAM